jgi:transposase InsO family protein
MACSRATQALLPIRTTAWLEKCRIPSESRPTLCQALGIEHRLTKPRTPKTNGMVERFNGRISDVLKTNRFNFALDMEQTLLRYVALYNHQLPQVSPEKQNPDAGHERLVPFPSTPVQ